MKKLLTFFATVFASSALTVQAAGWPDNYSGVMLQAFYWDSYNDTQWTNLTSKADELSKYYNLVWVPQSGYCNSLTNQMGYADIWWFDQKSAFGTASELKNMISTFKSKGIGTIADVVINHKNGNTNWCDFPTETWAGHGTMTWSLADICNNDDNGKTKAAGYNVTGANDTGIDFNGCRDLDHTSANVQKNIKLYLHFLLEEMGYSGFRYDMTGGYNPKYTKLYNEDAKPTYSVGEYWMSDGLAGLQKWINNTGKTSAAFDFQLKWLINSAFNNDSWNLLKSYTTQSLIGSGYSQYAVTFTDNHDTNRDGSQMLKKNIEAANAYILTMPGTPCVFLSHWKSYKKPIEKMILARKIAGVTNTSAVVSSTGETNGYSVVVKGTKGNILLCLGTTTANTTGYQLAVEGENYKMYVSNGLDITSIKDVDKQADDAVTLPSCAKPVTDAKYYAYFEKPSNWPSTINVWAWDGSVNVYSTWPGSSADVTVAGKNEKNGKTVYLWKYNGSKTVSKIIFNGGSDANKTADFEFKNGNYYTISGLYGNVNSSTTGIERVSTQSQTEPSKVWYTISGIRLNGEPTQRGIYIHNGKKLVIR